jgi:hypothetical protein
MRHTLKAVFDHRSDAQHLLDALLASGYPSIDMALSRAPPTSRAEGGGITVHSKDAVSPGSAAKRTFTRLFRSPPQAMDYFGRFIRRGHIVTLTIGSELEAKSAAGIIERFGPVGVEDLHDESDHGSAPDAVSMGSPRAAAMSSIYPVGTAPGALQKRAHEDRHYFGTQNAGSPPTGNTFQETMGAASHWDDADDDDTPDTRSSPVNGSHDNDLEAYRYGNEMRTNDEYRYCSWDEAERCLKKDWEARAPSASTWDECMSAVRRGWNSTSPESADDRYFRAHWNAIYRDSTGKPDYDERTPAYLYGSEIRRSEKYRSPDWRDVEPNIEADWKAHHPGQLSSWGYFKDAVKHGWNRISLDMDEKDAARQSQNASGTAADNRVGSASVERKTS